MNVRHNIRSPLADNPFCSFLNKIWSEGWLDEFSDKHFLIRAMKNTVNNYVGEQQLRENNWNLFNYDQNIGINFSMNFSGKLEYLCKMFGEEKIRKFVEHQLSAGKMNYNEDQFFRALTEVEVLKFFSTFVCSKNRECIYEPSLGINGSNPEARFIYDEDLIVDVEVKTPGFANHMLMENALIPTIALTNAGRKELSEFCDEKGISCIFPRIRKIVEFLNSASKKFNTPENSRHLNLLYINWSYSEFPKSSFLEAFSILCNEATGLLTHREIGIHFGVDETVYEKISAIIVYTSSMNNLVTQDFRYLWSTRKFAIVPLNGNMELIAKVTQMDYRKNPSPSLFMENFLCNESGDFIAASSITDEVRMILENNILKI